MLAKFTTTVIVGGTTLYYAGEMIKEFLWFKNVKYIKGARLHDYKDNY